MGTLRKLGKDWHLYDVKGLKKLYKTVSGISSRRVVLKRIIEKGNRVVKCGCSQNYKFESDIEVYENLGNVDVPLKIFHLKN